MDERAERGRMRYADPKAQERIDELEAEVENLKAKIEMLENQQEDYEHQIAFEYGYRPEDLS